MFIVFISFLATKISSPVPPDAQHKAITAQTNGKMILTDQLVIEDRKGRERRVQAGVVQEQQRVDQLHAGTGIGSGILSD